MKGFMVTSYKCRKFYYSVKTLEHSRETPVYYNQTATNQVLTAVLRIQILLGVFYVDSTNDYLPMRRRVL